MQELSQRIRSGIAAPYRVSGTPSRMSISLADEAKGWATGIPIEEGAMLAFNHIYTASWPMPAQPAENMLLWNICLAGRCETALTDDRYVIVSAGQMALGTQQAEKACNYPSSCYEGIELYFWLDAVRPDGFLAQCGVDIEALCKKFRCRTALYCCQTPKPVQEAAQQLWALRESEDTGGVRLHTALLLRALAAEPYTPEGVEWFTRTQIAIAREGERLLCRDLAQRIPLREVAAHFAVSESSFAHYFHGVFGKTPAEYVRVKRMEQAKCLLKAGTASVANVAAQVGYENQSKFAAVFREYCGMSPLEYRRAARLNAL